MITVIDQFCPKDTDCEKLKQALNDTLTSGMPEGFDPINELFDVFDLDNSALEEFGSSNFSNVSEITNEINATIQESPELSEAVNNVTETFNII